MTFSIFPILMIISIEKNDKVFEQLFSNPSSPLKIILYHFAAFTPFLILFYAIIYLLNFLAVLIAASTVPSDVYSLIIWAFALSTIIGLPLCYLVLFNEVVIPEKFMPIIILPIAGIAGLASLLNSSQSTLFETFYLATIIFSIIITIADVIETFFMKNRIVEMSVAA